MTFSYSSSVAADKDKVRLLIGDKTTPNHIFEDEEITGTLGITSAGTGKLAVFEAASLLCLAVATDRAKGAATVTIGGVSMTRFHVVERYQQLADRWKAKLEESVETDSVDWTDEDTRWAKVVTGSFADERETDRW